MRQAAFPTRILDMSKELQDLIWYEGKMDRSPRTVLFNTQNRTYPERSTLKKLQ